MTYHAALFFRLSQGIIRPADEMSKRREQKERRA